MRKLQVFSTWPLDLFFPRDITRLHFARSIPEAQDRRKQQPLHGKTVHP